MWETERVHGQSWGTFCPVVAGGKVIANVMRSVRFSGGDRVAASYEDRSGIGANINGQHVDIWKIAAMQSPVEEMSLEWMREWAEGRMPALPAAKTLQAGRTRRILEPAKAESKLRFGVGCGSKSCILTMERPASRNRQYLNQHQ